MSTDATDPLSPIRNGSPNLQHGIRGWNLGRGSRGGVGEQAMRMKPAAFRCWRAQWKAAS